MTWPQLSMGPNMKKANVHEAKSQLSKLLRRVAAGEEILIANRGLAGARRVPAVKLKARRELRIEKGPLKIAEDVDAVLPMEFSLSRQGCD